MSGGGSSPRKPAAVDCALWVAPIVASLATLGWLLAVGDRGFDFTDESYYLIWLQDPWRFPYSVTLFGFVYQPLQWLADGRIVLLRQLNVLLTFALAWYAAYRLMCTISTTISRQYGAALALVIACSGWMIFGRMLMVPSYNTLAFHGLLIVAIGLLMGWHNPSGLAAAAVGLGGAVVFAGKPSSAALLALTVPAVLVLMGRDRVRSLLYAGGSAVAFLIALAYFSDGSLAAFVHRLAVGFESSRILGVHTAQGIFRWDSFSLTRVEVSLFLALAMSSAAGTVFLASKKNTLNWLGALTLLPAAALSMVFVSGLLRPALPLHGFRGLLMLSITAGAALGYVWSAAWRAQALWQPKHLALIGFLLVLPHIYAFGSGNNYWKMAAFASYFWVLAGVAVLAVLRVPARAFLPLAVLSLLVVVAQLYSAMRQPYRQDQPMWTMDSSLTLPVTGDMLYVGSDTHRYVAELTNLAEQLGLDRTNVLLDLTGHFPGVPYVLGTQIVATPWMPDGYDGSRAFAEIMLASVSCATLAEAWLLVEQSATGRAQAELPTIYGALRDKDFSEAGRVIAGHGIGTQGETAHVLLRPIRPKATATEACRLARNQTN